jgi:hypothetical protein
MTTTDSNAEKSDWILCPPNPLFKRYYKTSIDRGCAEVSISAPGGKLPTGEDANELIWFFQLIIRQIERARDKAADDELKTTNGI